MVIETRRPRQGEASSVHLNRHPEPLTRPRIITVGPREDRPIWIQSPKNTDLLIEKTRCSPVLACDGNRRDGSPRVIAYVVDLSSIDRRRGAGVSSESVDQVAVAACRCRKTGTR